MNYRSSSALLLSLSLLACGPGTDDTAATDATTGPGASTTDAPSTGTPTSDTTTSEPTTTGQTSEPTTAATTGQTTTTTDATTTDATTGDATCPDTLPADGSPCAMEGQSCNSGCEDPCSFCNIVKCEGGTWQGQEVFPAQCLDCEAVCEFVVPAGCVGGPPDQATCVAGCMDNQAGDCSLLFNQMLACIGPQPTFTCSDTTRPIVEGCEDRFDALYMCTGL